VAADPLSDALALIDARCVVAGAFTAGGDWALRLRPRARLKLNAVVRGSCWLAAAGVEQPVLLREGDVAILNDREWDVLASDLALEPLDASALFARHADGVVRIGDGTDVAVVGTHIDVDQGGEDLLLAALPPLTHVRAGADEAPVLRWLLDRLLDEMATDRPVLASPPASMLHWCSSRCCVPTWPVPLSSRPDGLRALADYRLAPALRLMHADPGHPWHLTELARAASMSRTTFAERFRAAAGMPPLTYLHHWRMRMAKRVLRGGGHHDTRCWRPRSGTRRRARSAPRSNAPRCGAQALPGRLSIAVPLTAHHVSVLSHK